MVTQPDIADTLDHAADLLAGKGAWTQSTYARNAAGDRTTIQSADAVCWCLAGGIARVLGEDSISSLNRTLEIRKAALVPLIGKHVASWNDATGRTQAEVVAKLREAAAKARAQVSA